MEIMVCRNMLSIDSPARPEESNSPFCKGEIILPDYLFERNSEAVSLF